MSRDHLSNCRLVSKCMLYYKVNIICIPLACYYKITVKTIFIKMAIVTKYNIKKLELVKVVKQRSNVCL